MVRSPVDYRVYGPVQPPFQGQVLLTGLRTVPTLQFTQKPLHGPAAEGSVVTSLSVTGLVYEKEGEFRSGMPLI